MTNYQEMVSGTMKGALYCGEPLAYVGHTNGDWNRPTLYINASMSSSIYGASNTVTPTSLSCTYYMKY